MYRACIIGLGRIASLLERDPLRPPGSSHAGAYALCPDTEVVAGADVDPAALAAFGEDWKLSSEHLYPNYLDMLNRERPDIASICAYAPERLEMAAAALDAGAKGLWLEKALGCSLSEAERIQTLLQRHGAAGVVDYPRRGRSHYRKVKQLVEDETYGRLLTVTCHMTHQLIHTGTHAFDVLRYWCGEALEVSGRLEEGAAGDSLRDQGGAAEIQMSSGVRAFVSAFRKRYYIFQFDLVFEDARILLGNDVAKVYRPRPSKLYSGFRELFEEEDFNWGKPHPRPMLPELVHSLRSGEPPLYSVENAIEALRIALAIFDSAQKGSRPVAPRDLDPGLRIENV